MEKGNLRLILGYFQVIINDSIMDLIVISLKIFAIQILVTHVTV